MLQVDVCFLSCHLVSRWCHNISAIHQVVPQPLTEPDKRLSHIRLFTQTFSFRLNGFMCAFAFPPIRVRFVLTVFSRLEIVSVVLLSRVIKRGTFHSTRISRFIATPGPSRYKDPF